MGEFKVTKVVTRRRMEVPEILHGDPTLTGTVVSCRRIEKSRPAGWHGHPVLNDTIVPPQPGWHSHTVPPRHGCASPFFTRSRTKLFGWQFLGHLIHCFSLLESIS